MKFVPHPWPVIITSKNNAEAYVLAIDDDGPWNARKWLVVTCNDGQFWEIQTPDLRMHANFTMGIKKGKRP